MGNGAVEIHLRGQELMSETNWPAWLGAATGSIALIWNIFTYLTAGPRVAIATQLDARQVNLGPPDANGDRTMTTFPERHLRITAVNVGPIETYVAALSLDWYPSSVHRLLRKGRKRFFVPSPPGSGLPCSLRPGCEWYAMLKYVTILSNLPSKNGAAYAVVHFSGLGRVASRAVSLRQIRSGATKWDLPTQSDAEYAASGSS